MNKSKLLYRSNEQVYGVAVRAIDWVQYDCWLSVWEKGYMPVVLEMKMVQPYPVYVKNIPKTHRIEAKTISSLYMKVFRFFKQYKLEYRG